MSTQTQSAPGPFSTYLALTSFGIGTIFLILHLSFPLVDQIAIIGFVYVLLAIVLNGIALLYLLYHFIVNRFERETIAIRILILLANIPIVFLYLHIVINNFSLLT